MRLEKTLAALRGGPCLATGGHTLMAPPLPIQRSGTFPCEEQQRSARLGSNSAPTCTGRYPHRRGLARGRTASWSQNAGYGGRSRWNPVSGIA